MILKLNLDNFKAFRHLELSFSGVNLLTGLNGMGKSTVLQSLLLLKQSFSNPANRYLLLNGEYVQIGRGKDILYENAENDMIGIGIETDTNTYGFRFSYMSESEKLKISEGSLLPGELNQFLEQIYYLSAARIIPQSSYPITDAEIVNGRDFGKDGAYALQYLEEHGSEPVKNKRLLLGDDSQNSLLRQASLWMNYITPGINVEVQVNRAMQSADLRYSFREGMMKTNSYRSLNVGFGLTYVLPIVVQLLTAEAGDILLFENPEAHIHPSGQSRLGELAARAGSSDVQIIVESHSDHFLNGLRLAVKRNMIPVEKMKLFYFYKDQENFTHSVVTPAMYPDGQLDQWPSGFMDEWEKMLLELLE